MQVALVSFMWRESARWIASPKSSKPALRRGMRRDRLTARCRKTTARARYRRMLEEIFRTHAGAGAGVATGPLDGHAPMATEILRSC